MTPDGPARWEALPADLLRAVRLRADPPTWRAMDQTDAAARRALAPLYAQALRRLESLVRILKRRGWFCDPYNQAAAISLDLPDESVTVRACHRDGRWVLYGSRRRKLYILMALPDERVLVHLRPLLRRAVETGRACAVDLFVRRHLPLVRYAGPQLGLHPDFAFLGDLPAGGLRSRLALVLDVMVRAQPYGMTVHTAHSRLCTAFLGGHLQTVHEDGRSFEGDAAQTLAHVMEHHADARHIQITRPAGPWHTVTLAVFVEPLFNLAPPDRQLL